MAVSLDNAKLTAPDSSPDASPGSSSDFAPDPSPSSASDFDPVAYINTPRWRTSHLGLERIALLLKRLRRPQDALKFIHVAGTNGKGSTCAYLASVLIEAGYRTATFTSPYIETFEERISINGTPISHEDLTRATLTVKEQADIIERETGEHPTEFELMFAVACVYFRAMNCQIVVCEVGLGGRLDATNIIASPEVCVITPIAYDHTEYLGNTLADIAREKAGIIKPHTPVVCWPQEPEALDVIKKRADELECDLVIPDFEQLTLGTITKTQRTFTYKNRAFETALLGRYQPANAALALETLDVLRSRNWEIPNDAITRGIANATWPCRFEVVGTNPLVIVDGGHNAQGAQALASSLDEMVRSSTNSPVSPDTSAKQPPARVVFVMGVLADKDYPAMIDAVLPYARAFITYTIPHNERALKATALAEAIERATRTHETTSSIRIQSEVSPNAAMKRAFELATNDDIIVAFGSLYGAAAVKAAALNLRCLNEQLA